MQATIVLFNSGDIVENEKTTEITVSVSYVTLGDEKQKNASLDFSVLVKRNEDAKQIVNFGKDFDPEVPVTIVVQKPKGNVITQRSVTLADQATVKIEFALNKEVVPAKSDSLGESDQSPSYVYGRLLDKNGTRDMEDVQIVIHAKKIGEEFAPLTSVRTEANGYFFFEFPEGRFEAAFASIGLVLANNPIPIVLDKDRTSESESNALFFPPRIVLVAELGESSSPESVDHDDEANCFANEFGKRRVLEEFSFYSLIRTSEPPIKGFVVKNEDEITLEDVLRSLPFSIYDVVKPLKALPYFSEKPPVVLTRLEKRVGAPPPLPTATPAPTALPPVSEDPDKQFIEKLGSIKIKRPQLRAFLETHKAITKDNIGILMAQVEASQFDAEFVPPTRSVPRPVLGRVELDANHLIDWDDEPTIYQSVGIAHGHLLHYKTEWLTDGYSLGDLIYSLPLAPGQKKQIVTFDWDRRESASNEQSVDFEESLSNSLSRDRDIYEIANGTVRESSEGTSRAHVTAGAGGFGVVLGPVVIGAAGGHSRANSTATQESARQVAASNHQMLRDKIVQSANAVRSMRSTVIQTVSQGERFEVSSESVANYNHSHAITIQYFEVLRHFKVRQRFAGAQECLFIPLPIAQFDLKKALRWREALLPSLLNRKLAPGFDAGDRITHQWGDSNYPAGSYASERILFAAGVIKATFVLRRPVDKVDKDGKVEMILENWLPMNSLMLDDYVQFFENHIRFAADRDAVFHRELGGKIARAYVNNLTAVFVDESGNSFNADIDASLTSRYYKGGQLSISLSLKDPPTNFARDKVYFVKIKSKFEQDVLPAGSYMTIESGFMSYRTAHYSGHLFRYQYIGNDITAGDDAAIYAGPSAEELKDPRKEDVNLTNKLIAHLNDNLEYYHRRIWLGMSRERRFMLLDGIMLNGKGDMRSVASLVENNLMAVIGNSLVFPVAPGLNLNPDFANGDKLTEFYMTANPEPMSISVPTKGVFAEAVMGKCNSSEKIDESRFWRWEESPIPDSPTTINPINTDTRRADPGNLQAQAMPNPIVNIQNALGAPDPTGLAGTLGLLGQTGIFKDITGLEGNQKNAMQAFQSSMDAAQKFGDMGLKWKTAQMMEKRFDKVNNAIDADKTLTAEAKAKLKEQAISAYMGGGAKNASDNTSKGVSEFVDGAKSIDQLEKQKIITPQQAEKARDLILKRLADPTAGSSQSLMEKASETGSDVKTSTIAPDGTQINTEISRANGLPIGETSYGEFTLKNPDFAGHEGWEHKIKISIKTEVDSDGTSAVSYSIHNLTEDYCNVTIEPLIVDRLINIYQPKDPSSIVEIPPQKNKKDAIRFRIATADYKSIKIDPIRVFLGEINDSAESKIEFRFPFPEGINIPCTQSMNTSSTHTGRFGESYDFGMPRGSKVCAAANGIVVDIARKFRDLEPHSLPTDPAAIKKIKLEANVVRIKHIDDSYTVYGHLLKDGVVVRVGEKVTQGQQIGVSGNSGWTHGDHLHFAVERVSRTQLGRETVDTWHFVNDAGVVILVESGEIYERNAGNLPDLQFIADKGEPNGKFSAPLGSIYVDNEGKIGSLYYVKNAAQNGDPMQGWIAKPVF